MAKTKQTKQTKQKKQKKTLRIVRKKFVDDGRMWFSFGVQDLATDKEFRSVVARKLISLTNWPFKKGGPRGPIRDHRRRQQVVEATIEIEDYLQSTVPKRLRKRTYKIRSEGEALVRAADMYLKVYRENEKLGGEPALATEADVRKRIAKRRRRRGGSLRNRGFDPYVWGHDLSDLVFERIFIKWTAPKKCRIKFGIGS